MPDMTSAIFLLSNLRRFSSGAARPSAWLRARSAWLAASIASADARMAYRIACSAPFFSSIPNNASAPAAWRAFCVNCCILIGKTSREPFFLPVPDRSACG